jgi:DHA1 family multidrug resistance protein-like MFS transporter
MAGRNRVVETLAGQGVSRDLAVLSVAMSVAAFGAGLIIPLLAPLLADLPAPMFPATLFGLPVTTELQVGILFSVFGVVRSALQVPMGRLSDYVGVRKPFLEAGMLASAVTLYAYGAVGSVGALVTVRVLQGVALAVSTPALFAIVEGVTERTTRGGSMGFFSTLRTLGWGLGPVVGGVVVDVYGMPIAFTFGAVLTALAVGAIHLTVPEVRPRETNDATDTVLTDGAPASGDVLWLFSSRQQATTLLGLGLALVTLMMGFSAMIAMENPILERIGGTKAGFGLVFAITTLARLVFQFPVGVASDRYGRKQFVVWGLLASAPLVGLMGFAHTLVEFVALRGVLGVALAGVIAPTYALAADVVDDHRSGEQMAVVTTAFSVGFAFGPLLAGGVAFLGFAVPFVLAAVLTVVGAVAVWLLVDDPA